MHEEVCSAVGVVHGQEMERSTVNKALVKMATFWASSYVETLPINLIARLSLQDLVKGKGTEGPGTMHAALAMGM